MVKDLMKLKVGDMKVNGDETKNLKINGLNILIFDKF